MCNVYAGNLRVSGASSSVGGISNVEDALVVLVQTEHTSSGHERPYILGSKSSYASTYKGGIYTRVLSRDRGRIIDYVSLIPRIRGRAKPEEYRKRASGFGSNRSSHF